MSTNDLYQDRRIILAPMAGVSDDAFREICLSFGAQLTYTEMVSAKALSYGNVKTRDLLALAPSEDKVAVQIFGHEPDTMANEAYELEQAMGDAIFSIDINMGCPARKIAGKGDGSALMRDPVLAAKIVSAVENKVAAPVTVKMRRGFEMGHETAPELAHIVEGSGAAAVAVHGRFAQQFYQGDACWDTIARVKERVSIPVVGNGDITSGARAKAMLEQTGCDAIMVGRGAEGNPWIFTDIKAVLEGSEVPTAPSASERIDIALKHARMLADQYDDNIVKMRKHAMWYLRGLRGATKARRAINDAVTYDDFARIFQEVLELQDQPEASKVEENR
ncbi:tRNA dihydrouridine synthase DusB [Anaerotardibacter muris]|uniref:tRNA dihydrouridine synthase DusB n=1 Tax=Anaerotardibacter muris TaxID=2941505 RepID=UPI002040D1D0|nr:tRNA dihydrouridine synthase DusB [Anaerotardibacter muris]